MYSSFVLTRLREMAPASHIPAFPKGGPRLHAMLTSAGYDRRAGGSYDWHGMRRGEAPYVLVQHTLSGRGRLQFGSERHVVRPGQTMLLRFPHDHRYWCALGDTWEFFWLCLNGRDMARIWRDLMTAHGPLVTLGAAAVDQLATLCLSVLDGAAGSAPRASSLAYTGAMVLAEELLPWGEPATEHPDGVARAISLAQAQPGRKWDVAALAQAAGYSRWHFSRLFKAAHGISPARYLAAARMEEAMAALRAGKLPIKTIALRCGYGDPSYFAKAFRGIYGVNPGDVRGRQGRSGRISCRSR